MKKLLSLAVSAIVFALNWLSAQATNPARQYTFGANFFSAQVTNLRASPPVRVRVRELHGRIRYALGTWLANASAPVIADQLFFVRLPKDVRILGHLSLLSVSAGTAACTLTVGDSASTARHLAASAINAAAEYVPSAVTKNLGVVGYTTTDATLDGTGTPTATNDCDLLGLVAGAIIAVTQNLALHMAYVQD